MSLATTDRRARRRNDRRQIRRARYLLETSYWQARELELNVKQIGQLIEGDEDSDLAFDLVFNSPTNHLDAHAWLDAHNVRLDAVAEKRLRGLLIESYGFIEARESVYLELCRELVGIADPDDLFELVYGLPIAPADLDDWIRYREPEAELCQPA